MDGGFGTLISRSLCRCGRHDPHGFPGQTRRWRAGPETRAGGWNITLNNASAAVAQSIDQRLSPCRPMPKPVFLPAAASGRLSDHGHTPAGYVGPALQREAGNGHRRPANRNGMPEAIKSSISGFAFLDQNGDGVQQTSEPGTAHVKVELLSGGAVVRPIYVGKRRLLLHICQRRDYRVRASAPQAWSPRRPPPQKSSWPRTAPVCQFRIPRDKHGRRDRL